VHFDRARRARALFSRDGYLRCLSRMRSADVWVIKGAIDEDDDDTTMCVCVCVCVYVSDRYRDNLPILTRISVMHRQFSVSIRKIADKY